MLFLWVGINAQATTNSLAWKNISIERHDISYRELFKIIKVQTGVLFVYNNEEFDEDRKISIFAKEEPLKQVLDKAFLSSTFTWSFKDRTVIIKPLIDPLDYNIKINAPIDSLIDISGVIKDKTGNPIPGATISVIGKKTGAISSPDGRFVIRNVSKKSILKITSVGYLEQNLKVDFFKGNNLNLITLVESIGVLNGPVVEAYSVTSKKYSTSGIGTISAKEIERKPVANVLLALQGEIPGIIVQQSSGFANAGINVQIRGINSLTQGIDPLYVIDGVPYTSQLMETVMGANLGVSGDTYRNTFVKQGNPLSFINPADIESISVLKDADATSIYGSRAAAGAILITTKKGKAGPNRLNINIQQGWGKVTRFVDLLDRDEYMKMRHEAKANSNATILPTDYDLNGTWDTTRSTDWQKTLYGGTAKYSDFQVSTSGGTENTRFLIGAGYHKEGSVFINDIINKKGSLHFNITSNSPNQKFNLQLSGSYMLDNNMAPFASPVSSALSLPPVAPPLYKSDGSLNWQPDASGTSTFNNPIAGASLKAISKTNNLVSNLQLSYEIIPGLRLRGSFGFNNMQLNEVLTLPASVLAPDKQSSYTRTGSYSNGTIRSWIVEPLMTYEKLGKKGKLEALLGSTLQYNNNSQQVFKGIGFNSDQLIEDPNSATTIQYLSTTATTYRYNALFGRLNYRFIDRYLINLSARRDGSSRFGPENLFHNFASVGAAWIFSSERFVSNHLKFLSFGKLQFSYGNTGNDQIGDYQYLNAYSSINYPHNYLGITGLSVNGLANPYLQWEETKKMQASIDLGAIDNRILFNATYFRNRSSNQLLGYRLPSITGFTGYTRNFPATLQNSGWELSLSSDIIKAKQVGWSSRLNFYIPHNKLIAFYDLENSPYASTYKIGSPISEIKVFSYAGVNPETGVYQFKDIKGNITSSPQYPTDTRRINPNPAFTGGFSNTLTFKGFQLDILIQCNKQWIVTNSSGYGVVGSPTNQPKSVLDRWQKVGDKNASVQKFASQSTFPLLLGWIYSLSSDFNYLDSYYVRLKNVSVSWRIPDAWSKRVKIQNGQIFLHAQNLLTVTNFKFGDPETGINGVLPPLRMVTVGLQLSL